jgi:hypothetical protein
MSSAAMTAPAFFEDLFHPRALCAVLGMHGDQNITALHFLFVLLGFIFRHSHADESSGQASGRCASARESGHDWTGGYERSHTRDHQCPNTHYPTQGPTDDYPSTRSRCRALRRLGVLLVGEMPCSCLVGKQN